MATPLPTRREAQGSCTLLRDHPRVSSTYDLVLEAEHHAVASPEKATKLICARIVGWLLLYPVGDNPAPFVDEIETAKKRGDATKQIYELGRLYMHYIIPLCMYPCA